MRRWRQSTFFLFSIFFSSGSNAQEFAREISQFVGKNARPFIQPIANGLHFSMNGGLSVPASMTEGFSVSLGISATWAFIPDV